MLELFCTIFDFKNWFHIFQRFCCFMSLVLPRFAIYRLFIVIKLLSVYCDFYNENDKNSILGKKKRPP
jgi:hypothetical protein